MRTGSFGCLVILAYAQNTKLAERRNSAGIYTIISLYTREELEQLKVAYLHIALLVPTLVVAARNALGGRIGLPGNAVSYGRRSVGRQKVHLAQSTATIRSIRSLSNGDPKTHNTANVLSSHETWLGLKIVGQRRRWRGSRRRNR